MNAGLQTVGPKNRGMLILFSGPTGARTHPDTDRAKLNFPDMQPNLPYVDADSGRLIDSFTLPSKRYQLSTRHIGISPDNRVCIAMQYQDAVNQYQPLIATHQGVE